MSERKSDDKGMLNEVLPDPRQAEEAARGTPRERTGAHMKKLMAAAAGLAMGLPGGAFGDTTVPPKGKGKNPKGKPSEEEKQPTKPPPDPPGYLVVDPMPEPYREPKGSGRLNLGSTPPGAEITLDGKKTKLKTPQQNMKLNSGMHAITLSIPGQKLEQNFTVTITPGETLSEVRDLRPPRPAPKQEPPTPAPGTGVQPEHKPAPTK